MTGETIHQVGPDALPPTELGPSSLLWRWSGDSRIAFLGGTIGLLQLMHPAIGAGVIEHSNFFEDPGDRVFRSLPRILGVVYDDPQLATGREVRDMHRNIRGVDQRGATYHALDPATYWWAHATFQYMTEQVAEHWDRDRFTEEQRAQLYSEGVEWYRRYGVSDRAVPQDRAAFQDEWDRVCAEDLEMNDAVRFVLGLLDAPALAPSHPEAQIPRWLRPVTDSWPVRRLLARPSRTAAIGGLPPTVRERFGIRWSPRDEAQLRRMRWVVARTWPALPPRVRWQPRALEGWERTVGKAP